jgi:hypothetical protein
MSNKQYIDSLAIVLMMLVSPLACAGIAGNVQFVNGKVHITNSAARTYPLQKGDAVSESDTVTTTQGSSAQIRMRDGGFLVIRPDSKVKFDSFIFTGQEDGSERSFLSLLRGGIRAITGMIGQKNKSNYRIATISATIAIRGTDHETYVVTPDSPLASVAAVGTYNKVNLGETALINDQGSVAVLPNQMGFVAASDQVPQLQPVNLNIFTVAAAPLAQNNAGAGNVRAGSVVDNAVQNQDTLFGNQLPGNNIQTPITGRSGGPTSPSLVF